MGNFLALGAKFHQKEIHKFKAIGKHPEKKLWPNCEVRRKKSLEVTDQQVWESESEEKAQIQGIRGECPEEQSWPNGLVCKAQGRKVLKSQIQVWESKSEEKTRMVSSCPPDQLDKPARLRFKHNQNNYKY